jgi:hypothetical protein
MSIDTGRAFPELPCWGAWGKTMKLYRLANSVFNSWESLITTIGDCE